MNTSESPSGLNVVEGRYLRDILQQPEALADTASGLFVDPICRKIAAALKSGSLSRVVLSGMGSSFFALYPLHLRMIESGFNSIYVEASELVHYQEAALTASTLLILVSQSGRSAEILRLLDLADRRSATVLGVSNDEFSPLGKRAHSTVLIRAGKEYSVSCKTYVSTLLALEWLGALLLEGVTDLTKDTLSAAARCAQAYLAGWKGHVRSFAADLKEVNQIFVVGRGRSLAAALTGGLILKESTRFPAEGMSCASFRHGPFETVSRSVFVLVFEGDERTAALNRNLVEDIRSAGGRAALVTPASPVAELRIPDADSRIRPILEILPVQIVSLALAALAGKEAGRFERATKITATE